MSEQAETIADILAEMRRPHDEICAKCHEEPNESCPFCGDPDGCNSPDYGRWPGVMTEFADRIEAAHEHEKAELLNSINSSQINRVGNTKAMREALANLVDVIDRYDSGSPLWWHCGAKGVKPLKDAKAALAAPARNCDKFGNAVEAMAELKRIHNICAEENRRCLEDCPDCGKTWCSLAWLFASTEESEVATPQ